jgi:protein translocase SecG subunit
VKTILQVILVTDSIFLITLVLLQNRGTSLGSAFGGDSSVNYQRRGGEKVLHYITIFTAIVFVVSAFLSLFVK